MSPVTASEGGRPGAALAPSVEDPVAEQPIEPTAIAPARKVAAIRNVEHFVISSMSLHVRVVGSQMGGLPAAPWMPREPDPSPPRSVAEIDGPALIHGPD